MQKIISLLFKVLKKVYLYFLRIIEHVFCRLLFYIHNVQHKSFVSSGIPYISVALGGKCLIDKNFKMNNNLRGNPIGRPQRCVFFVDRGAVLTIGKNVGISSTAVVCHQSITIGDNVKIGGGVCLYDTDFHSLNPKIRENAIEDLKSKIKIPIVIKNNAFIGAHSIILKGVVIGTNSVVGASSVVTKSIPDNEIWAGNPARFIKTLPIDN